MATVCDEKGDSTKCLASESGEDIQLVKTNSIFRLSQRSLSVDQVQDHSNVPNSPRKSPAKSQAVGVHGHRVALSPISHSELGHLMSESSDSCDSRGRKSINNFMAASKDSTHVSHLRSKLGKSISEGNTYADVAPELSPDEHHEKVHRLHHHGLVNRVRSLSEDAVVTSAELEPEAASDEVSPLSADGYVDNIVHLEALSAFSFDPVDTGRVLSRSSSVDNHSSGSANGTPQGTTKHHNLHGSPVLGHSKHVHPVLAPLNVSLLHHNQQQHHHHHISHHDANPLPHLNAPVPHGPLSHHNGPPRSASHGASGHHHHHHGATSGVGQPHLSDFHQGRPHPPYTAYHPHSSGPTRGMGSMAGGSVYNAGGCQISKGLMDRLNAESAAEQKRRSHHHKELQFGDGKSDGKRDDFQVHYKHPVELIQDHYYEHNIVYDDEDEGTKDDDVYYY